MTDEIKNLYTLFGLKDFASSDEVKAARRTLANRLHSDHTSGDKVAENELKEINAAYDIIGPEGEKNGKKAIHDNLLKENNLFNLNTGFKAMETIIMVEALWMMQMTQSAFEFNRHMTHFIADLGLQQFTGFWNLMFGTMKHSPLTTTAASAAAQLDGKIALTTTPDRVSGLAG